MLDFLLLLLLLVLARLLLLLLLLLSPSLLVAIVVLSSNACNVGPATFLVLFSFGFNMLDPLARPLRPTPASILPPIDTIVCDTRIFNRPQFIPFQPSVI